MTADPTTAKAETKAETAMPSSVSSATRHNTQVDGTRSVTDDPAAYLAATFYLDTESTSVQDFVATHAADCTSDKDTAVALFYAIRDRLRYNPYGISYAPESYRASAVIDAESGWCVTKSATMVACLRACAIPARPGYADVRNHLTSAKLAEQMNTDVFSYHGYAEAWLDNRWVKTTPVFNIELCEKVGVRPQEFDGVRDSLFQEFDQSGRKHMEYIHMRGSYTDIPLGEILADFRERYPHLKLQRVDSDFADDAASFATSS